MNTYINIASEPQLRFIHNNECVPCDTHNLWPVVILDNNYKIMSDGNIYTICGDKLFFNCDPDIDIIDCTNLGLLVKHNKCYYYLVSNEYYCVGKINEISKPVCDTLYSIVAYIDGNTLFVYDLRTNKRYVCGTRISVDKSWILIVKRYSVTYSVTYLCNNKIIILTLKINDVTIYSYNEYDIDIGNIQPHKIEEINESRDYIIIDIYGKFYMMIWSYKSIKGSFYYRVEYIDCGDYLFSDFRFSSVDPRYIYFQTTDNTIIKFDTYSRKLEIIATDGTFSIKKNNTKASRLVANKLC
jgi:hypothetical protein